MDQKDREPDRGQEKDELTLEELDQVNGGITILSDPLLRDLGSPR